MYPNTDWWYTYPPEKWWSSSDWIIIQFLLAKIKSMVQTTNQLLDIYKQKTTDVPYFPPESILPCPQKSTRFPPKKNPPKKKKITTQLPPSAPAGRRWSPSGWPRWRGAWCGRLAGPHRTVESRGVWPWKNGDLTMKHRGNGIQPTKT